MWMFTALTTWKRILKPKQRNCEDCKLCFNANIQRAKDISCNTHFLVFESVLNPYYWIRETPEFGAATVWKCSITRHFIWNFQLGGVYESHGTIFSQLHLSQTSAFIFCAMKHFLYIQNPKKIGSWCHWRWWWFVARLSPKLQTALARVLDKLERN